MDFVSDLNQIQLLLLGFVVGAMLFYLLGRKFSAQAQQLTTQIAIAEEKIKFLQSKESDAQVLQAELMTAKTDNAELQARMEEQAKSTAEKFKLLQDAEAQLKTQFENLANRIFEDKSKQFKEVNKSSLDEVVQPLKDQLGEFKKRIEHVYEHETRDRVSLREEIVQLRRDTEKMNQEALNLTRALKGDNKVQGNWGEMILEKVLEQSGLRKGIEYETQGAFCVADNNLFKPDVIIRMPDNKDVVIDSKVSLLPYERYCNSEDDQELATALKEHTEAVRNHIKGLSNRYYSSLKW